MAFEEFKKTNNIEEQTTATIDFSKFDQNLDEETLAKLNTVQVRNDFVDIPEGQYNVALEDLCLKETKTGKLMIQARLKILDGEFINRAWFISFFPITKENKINNNMLAQANTFAKRLGCEQFEVSFNGKWNDYALTLSQILLFGKEKVDHYVLTYTTNTVGTWTNKEYDIVDAFTKEA